LGVAHIRVIPFSNTILTAAVIVVIIIIANNTIPTDLIIIFIFGIIHIFMKTGISAGYSLKCTGHYSPKYRTWDSKEQPDFVVDQLFKFFGSSTTK
jgi:hypothetical protein